MNSLLFCHNPREVHVMKSDGDTTHLQAMTDDLGRPSKRAKLDNGLNDLTAMQSIISVADLKTLQDVEGYDQVQVRRFLFRIHAPLIVAAIRRRIAKRFSS
jgi:hypothetical protein